MYYIGICDDSSLICSFIEQCITRQAKKERISIETEVWESGEELLYALKNNYDIDILFLDIELITMTGIEIAQYIRKQMDNYDMQIIYISGKEIYAFDLIDTQPLNFLIKPLNEKKVQEDKFEYTVGRSVIRISFDDIYYFYSMGRIIHIKMKTDIREFYGQLKEIYNRLPDSFYMIHQSYIVNSKYIIRYSYDSIELKNGELLTISKSYRKAIRQRLLKDGDL